MKRIIKTVSSEVQKCLTKAGIDFVRNDSGSTDSVYFVAGEREYRISDHSKKFFGEVRQYSDREIIESGISLLSDFDIDSAKLDAMLAQYEAKAEAEAEQKALQKLQWAVLSDENLKTYKNRAEKARKKGNATWEAIWNEKIARHNQAVLALGL